MRVALTKTFRFEAAHRLPFVPPEHKCGRLHGHSYQVDVMVEGDVDPSTGWLMDYGEMSRAFAELDDQLDHRYLNDLPGLANPTSEVLARWIWERLDGRLVGLTQVTIRETCTSACQYRGPGGQDTHKESRRDVAERFSSPATAY